MPRETVFIDTTGQLWAINLGLTGIYVGAILGFALRTERLAAGALYRNVLRFQHLVLQRVHARRGFVDAPHERDRPLQDRRQPLAILDARGGVLVLDDEMRGGDVERQQLAGGGPMLDPVDGLV